MKITQIGKICPGQDGAIYNGLLFRFDHSGLARVYDLNSLNTAEGTENALTAVDEFTLDRADEICPHSNAVMFGNEFYATGDEFPLLYSNVYNNYNRPDVKEKYVGVCCVYRLWRSEGRFRTKLVQLIRIGFTDDTELWRSKGERKDVRPFGNFTIDAEKGIYYAFVMRDNAGATRYFSFRLPGVQEGTDGYGLGIKTVTLSREDIIDYFDTPYHRYIQGATTHSGKIYSVEGFSENETNPPAFRIIDPAAKKQLTYVNIMKMGITVEPEFIDFYNGVCYYSDCHGNLFTAGF